MGLRLWALGALIAVVNGCFVLTGKRRNYQVLFLQLTLSLAFMRFYPTIQLKVTLDGGGEGVSSGGGPGLALPVKVSGGAQNPLQDLMDALDVFEYTPDSMSLSRTKVNLSTRRSDHFQPSRGRAGIR